MLCGTQKLILETEKYQINYLLRIIYLFKCLIICTVISNEIDSKINLLFSDKIEIKIGQRKGIKMIVTKALTISHFKSVEKPKYNEHY